GNASFASEPRCRKRRMDGEARREPGVESRVVCQRPADAFQLLEGAVRVANECQFDGRQVSGDDPTASIDENRTKKNQTSRTQLRPKWTTPRERDERMAFDVPKDARRRRH